MRGCGIEMSDEVQSERDGDGDRDKRAFNSAHHAEVGHQLGSSVGLEREREREGETTQHHGTFFPDDRATDGRTEEADGEVSALAAAAAA